MTHTVNSAFNESIDNYRLANLPVLKYEPTLWQRIKALVKAWIRWPWLWVRGRIEWQKELDRFEKWLANAKKPALLIHPDDLNKMPKSLLANCKKLGVQIKADAFMEKGRISGMDMAYFDFSYKPAPPTI